MAITVWLDGGRGPEREVVRAAAALARAEPGEARVLLVVQPATATRRFRAVVTIWQHGVVQVSAGLTPGRAWTRAEGWAPGEDLDVIGSEGLRRRRAGQTGRFARFVAGPREEWYGRACGWVGEAVRSALAKSAPARTCR